MFHLTFAKEDLEKVIEIESDRFQNLSYDEPAFQTEAGAVYGEYRIGAAQPVVALHEKLQDLAYDVHTYKHTTIGFEADVKAMPEGYEYSLAFYRRYYRPENVVLLVAGDVDPAATFRADRKVLRLVAEGLRAGRRSCPSRRRPRRARPKSRSPAGRCRSWCSPIRATPSIRPTATTWRPGCWASWPSVRKANCTRSSCCGSRRCEMLARRHSDQPRSAAVRRSRRWSRTPKTSRRSRDEIYRTLEEFKTKPVDRVEA